MSMEMKKGLSSIVEHTSSKFWIEQIIDDHLEQARQDIRTPGFHASSAGEVVRCPRLIQLKMNAVVQEKIEARIKRIFDVGRDVHLRYGRYFRAAGVLVQDEVRMEIRPDKDDEEFVIVGSADFIVKNLQGIHKLIELKSMNANNFQKLIEAGMPVEANLLQWTLYSKGLNIPEGVILYENKDDQRNKSFSVSFDQSKYDLVVNAFRSVHCANKKGVLLSKPAECPDSRFCVAKGLCSHE